MKFTSVLLSQLALATSILAFPAPAPEPVSVEPVLREIDPNSAFARARAERHAERKRKFELDIEGSKPIFNTRPGEAADAQFNETYGLVYSSNWAGVALTAPPSGTTFTAVTGTWNVPSLTKGSGSGPWYVAEWVGIDGYSDESLFQAGVLGEVTSSGTQTAYFWVEWIPNALSAVTSVAVSPGNTVKVTVTATSTTTGTILLDNVTTGKSTTVTLSAPSKSAALSGQSAEWIVEDVSSGSSLVPFGDFAPVTFTGASATVSSGATEGISSGTIIAIEQGSTVLTSTTILSSSSLEVTYV